MQDSTRGVLPVAAMMVVLAAAAGCSETMSPVTHSFSSMKAMVMPSSGRAYRASERERECLARAMFFESNRSSRDGLVAVGSVVMNRRDTGRWGNNICDVVGAKRQFAPGVLSRPMNSRALPDVMEAADAVLKGERHPKVDKDVMYFHTAGLKFPYKNMRYTTVAGGNAFYFKSNEKEDRLRRMDLPVETSQPQIMVADAAPARSDRNAPDWLSRQARSADAVALPERQETQVAFAGDTPDAPRKIDNLFTSTQRKKARNAEPQVALADEAPVPFEAVEKPQRVRAAAMPEESGDDPVLTAPADRRSTRKAKPRIKPETAKVVVASATGGGDGYEVPSAERFGGAAPAYNESGLSAGDGQGTGVLGRLTFGAD